MKTKPYDYVSAIIEFEEGGMEEDKILELFRYLRDSGIIWSLQGCYQRALATMEEQGLL